MCRSTKEVYMSVFAVLLCIFFILQGLSVALFKKKKEQYHELLICGTVSIGLFGLLLIAVVEGSTK
jgi:hypothetical protein